MPCRAVKFQLKMYARLFDMPCLLLPLTRYLDLHRQVEIGRAASGGPSARPLGACCWSCILTTTTTRDSDTRYSTHATGQASGFGSKTEPITEADPAYGGYQWGSFCCA